MTRGTDTPKKFKGCGAHGSLYNTSVSSDPWGDKRWDPWCLRCNPPRKVPNAATLKERLLRSLGVRRSKWEQRYVVLPGQGTLW